MLMPRKALSSEEVRRESVRLVLNGQEPRDVALEMEVSERSIWRWLRRWRQRGRLGDDVFVVRPGRGRPPKLDGSQAAQVLRWLDRPASDFGFVSERWTAPRVAAVIQQRLNVRMNHRYLNAWLQARGITPQIPQRIPRERDEAVINLWLQSMWPEIKKKSPTGTQPLFSRMKAGFCCFP
jgi:transposase